MPFAHHSRHRHQDGPDGGGKHIRRQLFLPRIVELGDARPASITSSVISMSLRMAGLLFSPSFILQLQFSFLSLQLRRRRFLKAGEGGFRPKLPPTP
ncbi:hypothetical protein AS890_12910 [Rhizobium anhuiense bv. trifolii]|nr:hypothetical protein AS890_12910 [Rhizobium anhuiense bv. trifolii]